MGRYGQLYAAGALTLAGFDNRISRTIAGVGPTETASGSFNSYLLGGRLETGWEQRFASFTVTPFAAVQFSELWQPGFAETTTAVATPGQLGLSYQSKTTPSLPTFVGVQLDTRVTFANGMVWSPLARLSWVHEFEPVRDLTATLSTLPLATFGIEGARAARDSARIDLGSKLAISRNAWLFASVVGEFSDISQAYAGKGGVRFTW